MKHIIIGTAGHIDHGKTALVKALTGIDADRLKEEKQRGITIDIGFADLHLDDYQFGFVDVPGHERFVKNMLAGAHGLDMVMLVIAADESVMPQTREHFDICKLLKIKTGLVVLTKADMVDEELLELARAEVEDYVKGSFLESSPIISVSSRTGAGIDKLKTALLDLAKTSQPKNTSATPRLPIDRAFTVKGYGTVVTGTLVAGEFKVGDEIEILPIGEKTRIRNLQVHGADTDIASAGQRTAVNLQGVNLEHAERGNVLTLANRLQSSSMLDVKLNLLASAPRPLSHRARVRLHHGTAEVMARVYFIKNPSSVAPISETRDEESNWQNYKPQFALEPNKSDFAQLRLEEPIAALPGDRFIIRSYSPQITIGGGVILDALPQKHRLHDAQARNHLIKLENATSVAEQIATFIEMAGEQAMTFGEIAAKTGATNKQILESISELKNKQQIIEVSALPLIFISKTNYEQLAAQVIALLETHHKREPLSLGMGREEVREKLFGKLQPEIFRAVIGFLSEQGKVTAEREVLRLSSHKLTLSNADSEIKNKLEMAIKAAGFQASSFDEIAGQLKIQTNLARKLYNLLLAEKRLIRIDDFVFHSEIIEDLKNRIREYKTKSTKIDVAAFKEITGGISRKHAIPLLEFLDRERVTRRLGNEREIL
ncbi:MAG: selenocysteine-specific translation elongation factor [Acidobacteriota bacterium]